MLNRFVLLLALLAYPLHGYQKGDAPPARRPRQAAKSATGRRPDAGAAPRGARRPAGDEEVRLGAAMAAQYDRERGIRPTPQSRQIESYLQAVADRLSPHASRKLRYRIHYDPYPAFKSAFALPGGHVIFGGGILALMKTEDELAAVLAHEIVHVDAGQVSERVARIAKERGISPADIRRWKVEDFGPSYTKQQELACDSGGARLAVKAGYSPFGLLHLLQTFQLLAGPQQPPVTPDKVTLAERIAQVQDEIRSEGWEGLTKERPLELP
jgi:beta-barrel assembly-enhancing protease